MQKTMMEPARATPIAHEADLCVVGGSCTGGFAAVRAARLGARVALIEQNGCFGGTATAGLVNVWHSLYDIE
ncbi:MAG: FAD-dependent oxidoreductase, partial [Lentisphaerae bacterium]|nr:FAD-dependent oxidoreductase [Lentisphaerota bacterium]